MGDILSSGLRRQNDRPSGTLARSSGEALVDALSDVLRAVRLTGAIFFDVQACEPWVAETPSGQTIVDAMFPGSEHLVCYHVITRGSCWACIPGEPPIRLSAGDIIVLPHGDTHVLSSTPGLRHSPDMSSVVFSAATRGRSIPCCRHCRASFCCPDMPAVRSLPTFSLHWPSQRNPDWAVSACSVA